MIIARDNFIGGLDLDTSLFAFDKSKYIDALNITRDAVQGNQDMVITNIVGNVLVNHAYPGRTIYHGDIGDYTLLVLNNGDGTQTVTITFTPSVSTTALALTYNDGITTVTVSLGLTSPQVVVIPNGVYTYGLSVTTNSGTSLVAFTASTITGRSKVIGSQSNTLRNTVIFMRWNEYACHGVYEYDATSNTITKIFENLTDSNNVDILGFTENDKITSIAIYNREEGDLLYFLDSLGRPTVMDITKFKAGDYTPVTRDIINAGKNPSLAPPYYIYGNDTTHRSNGLLNKFFRFIYRYVYDDNTKSSWSPISSVVVPTKILDQTYTNVITNNNLITLSLTSGAKDVKNVELAVSFANKSNEWSDFGLVESISKSANSIADDTVFSYNFYNDGAYPFIDIRDTDALFYYIPDEAKCMILANGNILVFGGITEGYDRTLSPNVTIAINTFASGSGGGGAFNVSYVFLSDREYMQFIGAPAVGTVINIKVKRKSDHAIIIASTYTTVSGDTASSVISNLIANLTAPSIIMEVYSVGGNIMVVTCASSVYESIDGTNISLPEVVTASASATLDSTPTWKWSTTRRIGIVYFDKKGKTNGVLYDTKITFPAYAENGSHEVLLPYINVKIYHQPPDWAYSYQFVITKEPTQYIFWESVSVNTSETDYIYFEVTNFQVNQDRNPTTANVLDYKFQDGDRLRLIRRVSDQTVFDDTYDVSIDGLLVEPKINGVTQTGKNFIKVKKVAPLSTVDYSSNNFVIELYRPGQTIASGNLEPFFEFGYQFAINNPTLSTRAHGGNVTNQSADYVTPAESNLYNGDSYLRLRSIYQTESGVASFYVQDRNIVDFYISAVSSCDGRPSVVDVNAGRQYFGALLRFGQSYEANTNVNGLNVFYADDFQEVDYSLGSVRRLTTRERFLRVFQDYKIGMIPLFSQINKTPNGDVMVQTDRLLNPIQYYTGNFGIGTAAESLASYNSADYFADNNRGVYCRVSNDGVVPISILYKVNSWATDNLPKRTGNYKIYGGYDPKSNNYISALEATNLDAAYTLTFDEESNAFESFLSYHPEMIVTLGTLLVTFKDGDLHTHNSDTYNQFYGTSYESNISLVFNDNVLFKKTWNGVSQISNVVWDCPLIYSNVNSYGNQRQETTLGESEFKVLEQMPTASIKRDINSGGGKINGAIMKGNYLVVKFRKNSASSLVYLAMVSVKFIDSPLTAK